MGAGACGGPGRGARLAEASVGWVRVARLPEGADGSDPLGWPSNNGFDDISDLPSALAIAGCGAARSDCGVGLRCVTGEFLRRRGR